MQIGIDGSIYIGGYTVGNQDGFLTKYNSEGEEEWTTLLGPISWEDGIGIQTTLDGSIYISAEKGGSDFDGQTGVGGRDGFLSKYNSQGEKQWMTMLDVDFATTLEIGLDGFIYVAGSTSGDLDGQINNGNEDAFIIKVSTEGEKQWTKLLGTSWNDDAWGIKTGLDGSIYIAGSTEGDLDGESNNGSYDRFVQNADDLSLIHI